MAPSIPGAGRAGTLRAGAAALLACAVAASCGPDGASSSRGGPPGGTGAVPVSGGPYGAPSAGFPGPVERAVTVLTNAVRLAPLDYRARYAADFSPSLSAAGVLAGYPAAGPLFWDPGLNQSARAHSVDMALTPCFQHDSCDGTSIWVRIGAYYTRSGTLGENIAAGYADARAAMNAWLCDASGGVCCADGASCDGHRRNIMAPGYQALGVGYAQQAGSPYGRYYTQDFGGAAPALPAAPPLVDGTHLLFPAGQTTFLANYHAGAAPQSVALVLDGGSQALAVDLGSAARGTWSVSLPRGSACRSYHFLAVDGSGIPWRYPASGEFRTAGEGSCAEDYVP
jgi:hypothetical protein